MTGRPLLVRVIMLEMHDNMRPCYLERHDNGVTMIVADPRTTPLEAVTWAQNNLTIEERNYVRAAHEQPAVGAGPLGDEVFDRPVAFVPASLIVDMKAPLRLERRTTARAQQEVRKLRQRAQDACTFRAIIREAM